MTTATVYALPLIAAPQKLTITLNGTQYNLRLLWNSAAGCWVLDIYDSGNTPLVTGIAVVTGVDLLAQYSYKGFGGALVALTDFAPYAVPSFANLGSGGQLYFVVLN